MQNHLRKIYENSLNLLVLFCSVKIQFNKKKLNQNQKWFILKEIVIKCLEYFHLHKLYWLEWDFVVSHLLHNSAYLKWQYLLHLTGYEQASNSYKMNVFGMKRSFGKIKKAIKDINCNEKCALFAAKRRKYFNHPVNHLCSDFLVNFVF